MFNIGIRKVGGIYFWYIGRFGGSFYLKAKPVRYWPCGWTEDGWLRHLDFVAEQAIIREIYR